MLIYTTIRHNFRRKQGLTCNEYILADMIYHLCNNANSKVMGWCYMSREEMGKQLGLSKQTALTLIKKLIVKGFIEKDEGTKFLRTTKNWDAVYFSEDGLPPVKKVYQGGKESLPDSGKESLPYNYNLDNNNNISKRKANFIDYVNTNHSNYPKKLKEEFIDYWTEHGINDKKMRFEKERSFGVERRLKMWAKNEKEFNKDTNTTTYNRDIPEH